MTTEPLYANEDRGLSSCYEGIYKGVCSSSVWRPTHVNRDPRFSLSQSGWCPVFYDFGRLQATNLLRLCSPEPKSTIQCPPKGITQY